jgi:HAD superfamily hydrolase (TIGR01509 family)
MTSDLDTTTAAAPVVDSRFDAAIFDLDGLLIDSEPFWRIAEREVFGAIGVVLSEEECGLTTGLRTDNVVAHWFEERPWDARAHPLAEVTLRINRRVVSLIGERGEPKEGVDHALTFMRDKGLRVALASASNMPVIEAALSRLGIAEQFEVVHSVDFEKRSKPAPDVYLGAARRLGVDPRRCFALEDSIPGTEAAKAAGMVCIRFPEHEGPVSRADLELGSLAELNEDVWRTLQAISTSPTHPATSSEDSRP